MAAALLRRATGIVKSIAQTCAFPESLLHMSPNSAMFAPVASQQRPLMDWRMMKDDKRRKMTKEYFPLRTRINAIRKNTILPKEIQELADQEIASLPRDSSYVRIRNRCVITARPRGVLRRWRLSRIVWRHLADYNKLSGVTRSCW
ncbi:small ribosomal subunit protein uS14m-like [Liolophura sinensis]|uniref:small ribosomal subunit protein uS14m-like n=1 Tax=Liolophura sinensis TaxID=3198878 RepID=UPI003158E4FF